MTNTNIRPDGRADGHKVHPYSNPDPYISITGNRWTKHYYIGSERIASRTGTLGDFAALHTSDNQSAGNGQVAFVNYAAIRQAEEDSIASYYAQLGVPYQVQRNTRGSGVHLYLPTSLLEDSRNTSTTSEYATSERDWDSSRSNTAFLDGGQVYYYHRDPLGSTLSVSDSVGTLVQQVEYTPWGEVFVELRGDSTFTTPYLFNGKELDEETGLYYYGARYYDPKLCVWYSTDPMQMDYPWVSTYGYTLDNPIKYLEPFGEEPVYNLDGKYIGSTIEGFKGDILIYLGKDNIFVEDMTRKELFNRYNNDVEALNMVASWGNGVMDRQSLSKIWTHIVSQFEGLQVYDEKFTLSSIADKEIKYMSDNQETCWYTITPNDPNSLPSIYGTSNNIYKYESTVENIASSIIVHEWYSHAKKHVSSRYSSHRLAYKNVINYKHLWDKTTDSYKKYNLDYLRYYTEKETGRKNVDRIYRNLYRRYVGN